MLLKSLEFVEFMNSPKFWHLQPMEFGQINLIVGKNSSGKSRVLNVLHVLGRLVGGNVQPQFDNGTWDAKFHRMKGLSVEDQRYRLSLKNHVVAYENFEIKDQSILERNASGEGHVLRRKSSDRIRYKVSPSQLMAVVRRDEYQHPQLDSLYNWGKNLCFYRFGSEFGKNMTTVVGSSAVDDELVQARGFAEGACQIFQVTEKRFGREYTDLILQDMESMGYPCEDVSLCPLPGVNVNGVMPLILQVKEANLPCYTTQHDMSQGMYRAFALSIHINANILWTQSMAVGRTPNLGDSPMVIIDDIGEGLDHERSKRLIGLLIEKAKAHNIQLVMSSNDRYVMNFVPLEYWNVLHRVGGVVKAFNYSNSKDKFDEFEYSGLSNFDFFASEYFLPD
jgi:energy-coupling factor transporter ATP-binding protein EcfA2